MSPSEQLSLSNQVLYKLAALDSAVTQGFRRLDEKMDRFQSDLHETQLETNDRINALEKDMNAKINAKRERIDTLVKEGELVKRTIESRITDSETWQKVITARAGVALAAIVIFWTVFGPTIRNWLGISNG